MKPVKFEEVNVVWAENQPQYQPLPAYRDKRMTVTCWALSWRERFVLLITGRLWLCQLNFNLPLQPQLPLVDKPNMEEVNVSADNPIEG